MVSTFSSKLDKWVDTFVKAFRIRKDYDHQIHELRECIITDDELIEWYRWSMSSLNKELIDLKAKHPTELEKM